MADQESENQSGEAPDAPAKPTRRTKARDERLLAVIDACADASYGSDTDTALAQSRELAIRRYLGDNIDPAPEGRSQVRDRSVFETVEWMKPSLLRIFAGTDEVAKFDPQGPEDEAQAQQESDYLNHVITQRNPWHQIVHDWLHDGLVCKNGYALAYWDETKQTEEEEYDDLPEDAFLLLTQDPEVEIIEHEQEPDDELNAYNNQQYQRILQQFQQQALQQQQPGAPPPQPPQPPPPAFKHSVVIRRTETEGRVRIETLAPERCRVDVNTKSHTLDECTYFEYWDFQTIGQLRAQGFDVPDDISDASRDDLVYNTEESARNLYNEALNQAMTDRPEDPSMRRVRIRYVWVRHDYNEDGIDEYQYVVVIGTQIFYREDCTGIPVASFSPIPLPHRHIGMSIADSVADIEDVNTAFTRQAIDNLFYSNNPRLAVSDRVNMGDLLDSRPGGVIRVDGQPPQEIMPVVVPDMFPNAVNALQFFDSRRMNRTGINAYFQGTDANVLNKTASGISQLTSSAAQRVELVARIFSFSVARLFSIVHRLLLQHGRKAETVMLRNKWVTVNPSEWRRRNDLKIVVGLGTGSKDAQLAALGNIFAAQMQTMPMGVSNPQNIYYTLVEMAKAASFTNPQAFFTDPSTVPPPQPQPDPLVQAAQVKAQADGQAKQADMQLESYKTQMQMQFEQWKFQQQQAFDKWKVEFDAQVRLALEQLKADTTKNVELTKVASQENMKSADMQMQAMQVHNEQSKVDESKQSVQSIADQLKTLHAALQEVAQGMSARRIAGIEKVRDASGRLVAGRIKRGDGTVEDIPIQ